MSKTAAKVVGVVAIVLSLVSAMFAAFYWIGIVVATEPRTKHGLLFAGIFVILLLFGIISMRSGGKGAASSTAK